MKNFLKVFVTIFSISLIGAGTTYIAVLAAATGAVVTPIIIVLMGMVALVAVAMALSN